MPINCFSNKGMFLETLINQTAWHYEAQGVALIYKRHLPISIHTVNAQGIITGKLLAKSTTDYYGVYRGHMLDFETKQTSFDYFMTSYLKRHQCDHLKMISHHDAISFLLVHFLATDQYFAVDIKTYLGMSQQSKIALCWFKQYGYELELIFPGILNLKNYIDWYIQNIL